jgi:hypothetical protein
MRELPERIRDRDRSTIRLDFTELGMIDAMLDGAVVSYGDGDSFSWLSGGGEYRYRGTRTGGTRAFDDGTPISTWLIEIEDTNQNLLHSYVFDGSREEPLTLHDGSLIPFMLANMTLNLAIDLQEEEAVLRTTTPFRVLPGGRFIVNPWYEGEV